VNKAQVSESKEKKKEASQQQINAFVKAASNNKISEIKKYLAIYTNNIVNGKNEVYIYIYIYIIKYY